MLDKNKQRETQRRWRAANKDKVREYNKRMWEKKTKFEQAARSRKWRAANPDKKAAEFKRYKERHPSWFKNYMRAWRRKQLAAPPPYEPPENCEACGRLMKRPNLDHCHLTNRFRGWICNQCNGALGLAGDTPEAVRRLLEYITQAYEAINRRLLMTEITSATIVVPAPSVIVDVEATIRAEVAKAVAAAKAEESKVVAWVKGVIAKYWPHVTAAGAGYAVAAFGVIDKILKWI
jgi:hypothetical protein